MHCSSRLSAVRYRDSEADGMGIEVQRDSDGMKREGEAKERGRAMVAGSTVPLE